MAELKIRDVNDHLVAFYKQRAKYKGISLEEELRQTLFEEQRRIRHEALDRLSELRADQEAKYGILPDSTPGIRAERDGEPDA
jgi:plasmid stability protein